MTQSRDLHWRAICDPAEPILADHRPGGRPLLGTVGHLEMVAVGLAARVPHGRIVAIEDIRIGPPLIFASDSPQMLGIAAETRADGTIDARSFSAAAPAAPHLEAGFRFARHFAPAPAFAAPDPGPAAVTAALVYGVLFHGPAFRVIDRAAFLGTMLVASSAASLPPLHRQAANST